MTPTLILGIESSCDEPAAAVVADGRQVRANAVASQIDLHARYGGIVPEIASRAHLEAINHVIAAALTEAGAAASDLTAVAVTCEPGLIGSLIVGLMAAKTVAWTHDLPLVGVNHVMAHAYAAALDDEAIDYPAVALVCSGGHTALYRCDSPTRMDLLGATIDDAAGEAFDKVASILALGFPGGPAIQRAAAGGDPSVVPLPRSLLKGQSLDFSFSGLKTAVLYHVNGLPEGRRKGTGKRSRKSVQATRAASQPSAGKGIEHFSEQEVADLAASFQAAVVDVLVAKLRRAAMQAGAHTLILGGGVSANSALRSAATDLADKLGVRLRLPKMAYTVDNAAMIAGLGHHLLQAGQTADYGLQARATVQR